MKAHYKTADGRLVFEVNGETPKALFEQVAAVQGLFEAETECGVCCGVKDGQQHNKGIRYSCRQDTEGNKYYSLLCLNCFAEFHFGQHRVGGGLFPKRKAEGQNGKLVGLPNRGWAKFERKPKPEPVGATDTAGPRPMPTQERQSARTPDLPSDYEPGITDDNVPF